MTDRHETFDQRGHLIEQTVDNRDGTGTYKTFDADGNETSSEQLTDLPIPEPPAPSVEEQLAEVQAQLDALLDALGGGQ